MRTALLFAAVALIATATPPVRAEDNKPPEGFTALFNGKNLDGWQGNIDMRQRAIHPAPFGIVADQHHARTDFQL